MNIRPAEAADAEQLVELAEAVGTEEGDWLISTSSWRHMRIRERTSPLVLSPRMGAIRSISFSAFWTCSSKALRVIADRIFDSRLRGTKATEGPRLEVM